MPLYLHVRRTTVLCQVLYEVRNGLKNVFKSDIIESALLGICLRQLESAGSYIFVIID
jgi:hypothetical protein